MICNDRVNDQSLFNFVGFNLAGLSSLVDQLANIHSMNGADLSLNGHLTLPFFTLYLNLTNNRELSKSIFLIFSSSRNDVISLLSSESHLFTRLSKIDAYLLKSACQPMCLCCCCFRWWYDRIWRLLLLTILFVLMKSLHFCCLSGKGALNLTMWEGWAVSS